MVRDNQHYYTEFPESKIKFKTISESLRRHLYVFKTTTGVYSYKNIDLGTKVLIENMMISLESSNLLDLGCGYGPIGIVLAYESPKSNVYLIDINRRAIWCAKENIKINKLVEDKKRIFVLSGNYFEPIENKGVKFDGIYMNPPIRQGKKTFLNICSKIPSYLTSNGFFQFVIKKKLGAESILNHLIELFPDKSISILCKRSGYWVFDFR